MVIIKLLNRFCLLVFFAALFCACGNTNAEATPPPTSQAQFIDATDLYKAYNANEVAADNNYKNKMWYVGGEIESISKDFMDNPVVSLKTSKEEFNVNTIMCTFKSANGLETLQKGKPIIVLGKCTGFTLGSVILTNCVIERKD